MSPKGSGAPTCQKLQPPHEGETVTDSRDFDALDLEPRDKADGGRAEIRHL